MSARRLIWGVAVLSSRGGNVLGRDVAIRGNVLVETLQCNVSTLVLKSPIHHVRACNWATPNNFVGLGANRHFLIANVFLLTLIINELATTQS